MPTRLLLDENISERVLGMLLPLFDSSVHVRRLGLAGAADRVLWDRARQDGLVLVTKDKDFVELSVMHGTPPKVIWLNVGNASSNTVASLLRSHADIIADFVAHPETGMLALSLPDASTSL